ncbi:hypothetical protein JD844_024122 [Phrynosoma platyrhinos]|uniref:ENTH domain-containing protein n=1 Tax=Phrynosoma platyrhinos TaxID=52577 RepID=A0ABQ7SXK6_PHRPL|nr:hypothetical protein JD844_024122 [Phrynosoma platyrhinos]
MADTLFERATNSSWVVVFKALVTTHHLMVHGNERFIQYLASRNTLFNLSNFLDKSGSHGYDMSTFIRRYSRYLNEKAFSYRQMAFDFARVKKGADGVMRTMVPEKLLKSMPILQGQIDALLEFDQVGIDKGDIPDLTQVLLTRVLCDLKSSDDNEKAPFKDYAIDEPLWHEHANIPELFFIWGKTKPFYVHSSSSGAPSPLSKSSPATTVTSPNSTPAKSIDTSPPVDLFATSSTAAPLSASKPSSDLLDLQPDFTSTTAPAASAASAGATSWGDSLAALSGVTSEPQITDPFAPEPTPAPPAATTELATASSSATAPVTTATEVDLFGDAFAASPGEAPAAPEGAAAPATPTPVAAALDACSGNDPFAPSEGSAEAAQELDLFAMKPTETSVPVVTPTTSATTPVPATTPTPAAAAAVAPPTLATTASTTTTTATTSATTTTTTTSAPPALDIFGDLFDSAPPEAPAAPKPDATPNIDLFGTDAFSSPPTGASPVPESSLTGDLLSVDAFAAPSSLPPGSPAKVESSGVIDLFGDAFGSSAPESQPATQAASSSSASADLLAGFGGSFIAPSPSPSPVTPAQTNILQPNFEAAFGASPSPSPGGTSFDPSVFDGLGDLLMPTMTPSGQPLSASGTAASASAATKGIGSDLDSSLANLVGNLGISATVSKKGDLQWNAGEKKLTGGANWQPKVAPATWSTGVPPSSPMTGSVPPAGAVPPASGSAPVQPGSGFGMQPPGAGVPMMPQQPVMYGQPVMRPPFGAAAAPGAQLSPSPTPATQSPKKPPTKDPLADLNIKDFL